MNLSSLFQFRDRSSLVRPEVNPFGSLQREIDRPFDEFTRGVPIATQALLGIVPSVDVAETDKEIEITAELPGLERKDVEISLEDDMLTIREGRRHRRAERRTRQMRRRHYQPHGKQGRVLFFDRRLAAPVQSAHVVLPELAPPS